MGKKIIATCMAVILLAAMVVLSKQAAIYTINARNDKQKVIVIDAGHGGNDPGKVGVDQTLEKDINLQIALKLEALLQQSDLIVVLTRHEDCGLYDADAGNKKVQDMRRRIDFMQKQNADLVISIHQNSFRDSSVKGAQCFYYAASKEGKRAASLIQGTLNEGLNKDNPRSEKANDSYYILKKSAMPTVIVECGFLSNPEDTCLLSDDDYQEKVAFQIYLGIQKCFNDF